MLKSALVILGIILYCNTFSQTRPVCATNEYIQQLEQQYPGYLQQLNTIDMHVDEMIKNKSESRSSEDTIVYYIPVVFHVVYNNLTENVSDAQLLSQLDVLNEDYRRLNVDRTNTPAAFEDLAADTYIQFIMAEVDPDGNPTDGITRTETTITSWNLFTGPGEDNYAENIKFTDKNGHDIWDRNCYLNIWVGDLGASILGYAQPPGGALLKDGVVIGYKWIGTGGTSIYPYNRGRTTTHEVGHWLSLKHIWGDDGNSCVGSDLVADTPNQAGENYGCPNFPKTDACSPTAPGVMFMNYMDYTDDNCMNMFTQGQANKMRAIMVSTREEILECASLVNIPSVNSSVPFGLSVYPNPATDAIVLRSNGLNINTLFVDVFNIMGERVYSETFAGNETAHLIQVNSFSVGSYLIRVTDGTVSETIQFIVTK
ncbi:MAG: T9SS type A sorting domain-containing protein [Chitinophagales bacterium]|nr:T9SS type A sorting domain-containing protein [Chitinophagales bacterium]MBP9548097.1 T9SS type A sorting domain-containing protein [Chitinophagales bacterium]